MKLKRIRWKGSGINRHGSRAGFGLGVWRLPLAGWQWQITYRGTACAWGTKLSRRAGQRACREWIKRLCEACRELEGE